VTIARKRPLNDQDHDLIRLVARAHSNEEIAQILDISHGALMNRMNTLHYLIGSNAGVHRKAGARLRIVIWAYENGLMDRQPAPACAPPPPAPLRPAPGPTLPLELAGPLLALCQAIVQDQPRGDLRKHATAALRAASLLHRHIDQPSRPADVT
jgi:hypothetical protein